MSRKDDFLLAVKGLGGYNVAVALSQLTPGIDWSGCSKTHMAEEYESAITATAVFPHMANVDLRRLSDMAKARADGNPYWREVQ